MPASISLFCNYPAEDSPEEVSEEMVKKTSKRRATTPVEPSTRWTRSLTRAYAERANRRPNGDDPNFSYLTANDLPDDVLVEIFQYLSVEDLALNIPFVCRRWAALAQTSCLWKNKAYEPSDDTPLNYIIKVLKHAPKLEIFSVSENYHIAPRIFDALSARAWEITEVSKVSKFQSLHDKWRSKPCTSREAEFATLRSRVKTRLVLNYYVLRSMPAAKKKKS